MEQVHGIDVSWMTPGFSKDKLNKSSLPPQPSASQPRQIPTVSNTSDPSHQFKDTKASPLAIGSGSSPSSLTKRLSRSGSFERQSGTGGTPPGRRSSWFSNISAKFSGSSSPAAANGPLSLSEPTSSHHQHQQNHATFPRRNTTQAEEPLELGQLSELPVPKISPSKNAVLQPGAKPEGSGPYTPAPPRTGQAGILGVLRRLSSASVITQGRLSHGLVERKILNKDLNRERCPISELNAAKLRRVAFCVDVEIAPMPKFPDGENGANTMDKSARKKPTENDEAEVLKNANVASKEKDIGDDSKPAPAADPKVNACLDKTSQEPENSSSVQTDTKPIDQSEKGKVESSAAEVEKEPSKKREKKKRSEEERKARKERRLRLAQDNGTIPLEIHYDDDISSDSTSPGTPNTASAFTTNPVRIYRRCCQLRETPILKKITEQLLDTSNVSYGIVNKLDITGYWLQLADLVTLGDYLAVVPVREVLLENIILTDEGLRVILAGLLAAKRPGPSCKKPKYDPELQGGVVERLVLKNNRLGPEGWKHLSLFIYLCHSIKHLDISKIPFPRQNVLQAGATLPDGQHNPRSIAEVLAASLANRPGGSTLELINMGETEPSMEQLGIILDGMMKCRVNRVGLAHNYLDEQGLGHVARYISSGICEGLDLGGNDLGGHVEKIASALEENGRVWALSLAGCELTPSDISKLLPVLANMQDFRFIDLSHNKELFQSKPSAVGPLRRYLPKLQSLKRIHLVDVSMDSEQAIALVEVLPETQQLAHINLLENEELAKLAHAKSEEEQEEACALYASLMAAARVSKSIIAIDIDVPDDEAGEIVKAMAKQVVAYCLRNMEYLSDTGLIGTCVTASSSSETNGDKKIESKPAACSNVIMQLAGNDEMQESDEEDNSSAPDGDYVIGGTGVVKALKCCLENRGEESRRPSCELVRDMGANDDGESSLHRNGLPTGRKAKDMSKHLLAGARKIQLRLQPALAKARANSDDEMNLRKLMFLDETLQGIIRRFEDEYPDTREPSRTGESGGPKQGRESCWLSSSQQQQKHGEGSTTGTATTTPTTSTAATEDVAATASDGDEEGEVHRADGGDVSGVGSAGDLPVRRSSSSMQMSREQVEEEGRVHRAGYRFRVGVAASQTQLELVASVADIEADPKHARLLAELAEDVGGEFLEEVRARGVVEAYRHGRDALLAALRASDPDFERFVEAQAKALANRTVTPSDEERTGG